MTATAITIVGSFRDPTRRIERALSVRLGPLTTEGRMAAPAGHTAIMSSILAPSCTARPSAASRSSTGEIDRLRVRLGIPRVGVLVRLNRATIVPSPSRLCRRWTTLSPATPTVSRTTGQPRRCSRPARSPRKPHSRLPADGQTPARRILRQHRGRR